jgi:hypothetical protein
MPSAAHGAVDIYAVRFDIKGFHHFVKQYRYVFEFHVMPL